MNQLDPLTHLPDRFAFCDRLKRACDDLKGVDGHFSLLMLDIDRFHKINTDYGHARGDQVLVELVHRLTALSRESDLIYRYGGDEFVGILFDTPLSSAKIYAERLFTRITSEHFPGTPHISTSLSIGIAEYPEDGRTPETLFEVVDKRHKFTKRDGGGGITTQEYSKPYNSMLDPPDRLYDRQTDQETLYTFLNNLHNHGRGAFKVVGPTGTGRSRFLKESEKIARFLGYAVIPIKGRPALRNRIYGALLETTLDFEHLPAPTEGVRVFADALSSWVVEKGKSGLLITIDDMSFLDAGSFIFLEQLFFLDEQPTLGMMYVSDGTKAGDKFPENIPLQENVNLQPITEAGVQDWLRESLGWEAPEEFIKWLYAASGGNANAVVQSLLYLRENDWVKSVSGSWVFPKDLDGIPLRSYLKQLSNQPPNNLPALENGRASSFIGREQEIKRLKDAVPGHSLITITGIGGIGKSWLALQLAHELLPEYTDGVYIVQTDGLRAIDLLVSRIINNIGLTISGYHNPEELLRNFLYGKKMLLILDNYEKIRDGRKWLESLVESSPGICILLTSRERLGGSVEWGYGLTGLPYPSKEDEDIESYPAVQLLLDRLTRAQKGLHLKGLLPNISAICEILAGHPLGIEIAAAWLPILSAEWLVAEMGQTSGTSAANPSGITTLLETVWKALSAGEQSVLNKLSVFEGRFSAEAAENIAGASSFMLSAASRNYMIQDVGSTLFDQHHVIRQFGRLKLQDEPRAWILTRDRHSAYFLKLLHPHRLIKLGDAAVMDEIRENHPNIISGWNWALSRAKLGIIQPAIKGMAAYYQHIGLTNEGEKVFGAAVEIVQALGSEANVLQQEQQIVLGELLSTHASFLNQNGYPNRALDAAQSAAELCAEGGRLDLEANARMVWAEALNLLSAPEKALTKAQEALVLAQSFGDPGQQVAALQLKGDLMVHLDREGASQAYERALKTAVDMGDERSQSAVRIRLGLLYSLGGDFDGARSEYEAALSVYSASNDRVRQTSTLSNLGQFAIDMGDYARARYYFEQALHIAQDLGNSWTINQSLFQLGLCTQRLGDFGSARAYFEQTAMVSGEIGDWVNQNRAKSQLGFIAFQSGEAEKALKYQQDILEFLEEEQDSDLLSTILFRYGIALTQLERFEQASEALHHSLELRRRVGKPEQLLDPLAGLAQNEYQKGDFEEALKYVEKISAMVDGFIAEGWSDDPYWIYLVCYRVFQENEDERAQVWSERGRSILLEKADLLSDGSMRQAFLEDVPSHRSLWQSEIFN